MMPDTVPSFVVAVGGSAIVERPSLESKAPKMSIQPNNTHFAKHVNRLGRLAYLNYQRRRGADDFAEALSNRLDGVGEKGYSIGRDCGERWGN